MNNKKISEQQIIEKDVMLYKTNKWPRMLALLSLVFNCLYFMLLYAQNDLSYYTIEIGVSVILTLIVLLTVFLSSEGIKNYSKGYCYVVIVIAVFQILRIFGYPLTGLQNNTLTAGYFGYYPETSEVEFTILVVYLVASAACLIASGVGGWIMASKLEAYRKKVESGEVDIQSIIKKLDEEEAADASAYTASNASKGVD